MSQITPLQPGFTLSHAYDNTKESEEEPLNAYHICEKPVSPVYPVVVIGTP